MVIKVIRLSCGGENNNNYYYQPRDEDQDVVMLQNIFQPFSADDRIKFFMPSKANSLKNRLYPSKNDI